MRGKIEVVFGPRPDSFLLRLHVETREGEVIRFETAPEFSKSEADFRAMSLSSAHGWKRDPLPTQHACKAYPKAEELS